jgi:hypothetical protein
VLHFPLAWPVVACLDLLALAYLYSFVATPVCWTGVAVLVDLALDFVKMSYAFYSIFRLSGGAVQYGQSSPSSSFL